jgi:hypothetical protein
MDNAKKERVDRATAPYTSFPSFKTFVKNLKEHGLPSRIDRSVLGNSFSNAVGSQILTALKFLLLTDGNSNPTEALKALVKSYGADDWPVALTAVVKKAYQPLFQINLETASPNQFNERFRDAYSGTDDVQRKSMTFFLTAAREGGIKVSQYIMKNKKPRSAPAKKHTPKSKNEKTRKNNTGSAGENGGDEETAQKLPSEMLLGLFNPTEMEKVEQDAVWTLIKYFKAKNE